MTLNLPPEALAILVIAGIWALSYVVSKLYNALVLAVLSKLTTNDSDQREAS